MLAARMCWYRDLGYVPFVSYGVKYIDLVSLGAKYRGAGSPTASGPHLDLSRAPYVLYGVEYIYINNIYIINNARSVGVAWRCHTDLTQCPVCWWLWQGDDNTDLSDTLKRHVSTRRLSASEIKESKKSSTKSKAANDSGVDVLVP